MTTLYLATGEGPIVVVSRGEQWQATQSLDVRSVSSIAADPRRPQRVYCGTMHQGVWKSDDAGTNWRRIVSGIPHDRITSVAVSAVEQADEFGVVYVGTEPSAVFRSEDGGETFAECVGLCDLPSAHQWSFPPRPETHHVRWIQPDPHAPGRIYVAIEAGALVVSPDGGKTWQDHVSGSPYDTHQLVTHPKAPGQLWSAAGDGFFKSDDSGNSWRRAEDGLRFRYCWSVAVDSKDPTIALVAASPSPRQAHTLEHAESAIFRRSGNNPWQEIHHGLPPSRGTRTPILSASSSHPGTFYCAASTSIYRSTDAGIRWQRLPIELPISNSEMRIHALAALELS